MRSFGLRATALLLVLLLSAPLVSQNRSREDEVFANSLRAAAEALREYGLYERPDEMRRVAEIGYRVAREANFDKYPISFYLIDMAEPNAFALPGGQIFITRGMLDIGLSDDALAALLGHEIGHVVREHGLRMQRRATLLNVLSQALMIGVMVHASQQQPQLSRVPDPYGVERSSSSAGDLVQGTYAASIIVGELLLRSYSREFEDEADQEGQRYAAAAGFAPDGAQKLMAQLGSRLPQSREYGYWRTHPFFEDRTRAAEARGVELKRLEAREAAAFRQATQRTLLDRLTAVAEMAARDRPRPEERQRPGESGRPGVEAQPPRTAPVDPRDLVKKAALTAWPLGEVAEGLRLERLRELRRGELAKPALERDYGRLVAAYDGEIGEVATLSSESPALATLRGEREELERARRELAPQAETVWKSGVWETAFLENWLSNYPEAPNSPEVALALGESYSRIGRQADAVEKLLLARRKAPETPIAEKANATLRRFVGVLDRLAALGELAEQTEDPDLARMADRRLAQLAATFDDLANGAEYLRRFPQGDHRQEITERQNRLAMNLYGEVVLYQGIGDSLKALERIQKILTHASTSPAADRLREKVVVEG